MDGFFITRAITKANHAGSKAVSDTDSIMQKEGLKKIEIYTSSSKNRFISKLQNYLSLRNIYNVTNNSLVVVEHPLYINKRYIRFIKKCKEKKSVKLAFIIHDYETIRNLFPENVDIRIVEKIVLEIADVLIVHNDKMKKVFVEKYNVDESKIVSLNIFDYLCEGEITREKCSKDSVTVAGNLNPQKSGYVYRLKEQCKNIKYNLYGVNYEGSETEENVTYHGSVDSNLLPNVLQGGFGLVWDGNSAESCVGNTGEYLRVNNPHKTSLYLASGVPVIVWKEAAIADFVTKNGVGICVSSLNEIPEKIGELTDEDYDKMVESAKSIGTKLREGHYFATALRKANEIVNAR